MLKASHLALIVLLAGACFSPLLAAQDSDIAVVVNARNPATNVSMADLRKLFAGQKPSWPNSVPVKIIVRTPGCRERFTLLKLLGFSETDYKLYWTALVVRGEADYEPVAVFSAGMQKEAIAAFPGAVTLIDSREIKPGMKILKVDGHFPNDPGYPVR